MRGSGAAFPDSGIPGLRADPPFDCRSTPARARDRMRSGGSRCTHRPRPRIGWHGFLFTARVRRPDHGAGWSSPWANPPPRFGRWVYKPRRSRRIDGGRSDYDDRGPGRVQAQVHALDFGRPDHPVLADRDHLLLHPREGAGPRVPDVCDRPGADASAHGTGRWGPLLPGVRDLQLEAVRLLPVVWKAPPGATALTGRPPRAGLGRDSGAPSAPDPPEMRRGVRHGSELWGGATSPRV